MKKGLFITAAAGALFFAFLSPLFADEASERRLGEEALSAGDYKSAAKFFDNARLIAGDDAERWGVNTLSMAEAKLRDGDVEEAKQLLAEYRSRFPARSAGMLPGLILMAEKRYGEAETFCVARLGSLRPGRRLCGRARYRRSAAPAEKL